MRTCSVDTRALHGCVVGVQGTSPGPTLIYAQTTNEVDSLTAHLQAKGVKAVK
jgi:hypothetical protein